MKKLLLTSCLCAILLQSAGLVWARNDTVTGTQSGTTASTSGAALNSNAHAVQSKDGADSVSKTAEGADYSAGAGDSAAQVDIGLSAVSGALTGLALAERFLNDGKQTLISRGTSELASMVSIYPVWMNHYWFPVFISTDPVGILITLGHAAVNKFMRDATNITADFTGAQGFVTDKWVGPHPRNTTTDIMGDIGSIDSQRFGSLAFNKDDYEGLDDASHASARELMDYRSEQLIEDQRSLANVAGLNWGLLYRAQQRSIRGLAGALELKSQLAVLGEIENRISADYSTKPAALNTVAARRVLNDALWALKANVMAARTKLRSETLELDFKPMTRAPETVEEEETPQIEVPILSVTGGQ